MIKESIKLPITIPFEGHNHGSTKLFENFLFLECITLKCCCYTYIMYVRSMSIWYTTRLDYASCYAW